jgi:hypothetical protein
MNKGLSPRHSTVEIMRRMNLDLGFQSSGVNLDLESSPSGLEWVEVHVLRDNGDW